MVPAVPEPKGPLANFYASVIDDTEALAAAHEIEGFDDELALLRTKLKERLDEARKYGKDVDDQLMLRSVTLIVRAVAARYRMSAKHARDLTESALDTLRRLADDVMPRPVEDV